ncbi:MAG: SusD/RagB family nutrient-binding outer membrane lipoprotein, partial [Sphingobacteriaceae bacterium]
MKRLMTLAFFIATIILSACKKEYFDINDNPNTSTNAYPGLVLTNALNTTARTTTGSYEFYRFAAPWIGYWNFSGSISGFLEERSYNITQNYAGAINTWASLYNNLEDYYYLEQQGKTLSKPYFIAFAKTMKAYDFQYLVDFYGNIPYSQSLQSTKYIRPQYDKDLAVYEDLANQLDSAATIFKANIGKVESSDVVYDIIYAGDLTKWGKLANTIKLRLLLRQTEISGRTDYIKAQIAKIDANGMGYIGVGETSNVQPGYLNSDGKQNPFYASFGYTAAASKTLQAGHQYYLAAEYSLNFYQNNNDARLRRFYTTINEGAGSTYVGHPFGPTATNAEKPDQISAIGPGLVSFPSDASKPQPLIT